MGSVPNPSDGLSLVKSWANDRRNFGKNMGKKQGKTQVFVILSSFCDLAPLDGEQAWTSILNVKSFVMDSAQVGKAVFGKERYTTLGIEPRTYSNQGRYGNPYSVCWVKKFDLAHFQSDVHLFAKRINIVLNHNHKRQNHNNTGDRH